ncbi:hypothetical protein [Catenulispora pinisilvae]|nr:hypothetical protein [Catenulispora pinisilvae]
MDHDTDRDTDSDTDRDTDSDTDQDLDSDGAASPPPRDRAQPDAPLEGT